MEPGVELELPAPDERERLIEALGHLVKRRGFEHLVGSPVLLPSSTHFPDRWRDGPQGVLVIARRLLRYAGLDHLRVHLTLYDNLEHEQYDSHGVGHGAAGAAAWFAGISGELCRFGVERRELRDVEELVGTLGHEVAHAYRSFHGLTASDPALEEHLTDLTAVYLGFGVFLLRSSFSIETGGYSASGERLSWEKRARGYLSPARIALLLAAQSVLRGAGAEERKEIRDALGANHAMLYRKACDLLEPERDALRGRVGVPDPDDWPATAELEPSPLPEREGDQIVDARARDGGMAKLRVAHHGGLLAVLGAGLPFIAASAELIQGTPLAIAAALGGAAGYGLGRCMVTRRCSQCHARTGHAAPSCDGCGAQFEAGEVGGRKSDAGERDDDTDPTVSDEERVQARLLSAMFLAWAIRQELVSASFLAANADLVERVRKGETDSHALHAAWLAAREPFDERGARFYDRYMGPEGIWPEGDWRALATAELVDTPGTYRRFAALLDRRFREHEDLGPVRRH